MPIASYAPMAVTPCNRTAYVDQSTVPLITGLLNNPDARRYYLLELSPYDPDGEDVLTRKPTEPASPASRVVTWSGTRT